MDAETFLRSRIADGSLSYERLARLVRAFQRQNGLKEDGKPGRVTFERVGRVLGGAPSVEPIPAAPPERDASADEASGLFGIDIDHHQSLNRDALDLSAVQFAFLGVTEGTSGRAAVDSKFQDHIVTLSTAGVDLLGVYHFARPSSARSHGPAFGQPQGEAENFARQWEIAKVRAVELLPPVLDMEDEKEKLTPKALIDWTLEWCEHCIRLTGREPIIYTYFSFIHTELKGYVGDLTRYRLWLADYRGEPPEKAPREIPNWPWLIWQFTGTGSVRGVSGQCDRNYFRGTRSELESLCL